ncbi:MAG: hypothetical protein JXM73_08515 [Anaerolineae bacterium]|nr:hypothetical protein [Anaerolineae bacterium]
MREYKLRECKPGKFVWVDPVTGDVFGSAAPEQVSLWLKGGQAVEVFAQRPDRQSSWSASRSARQELLWLLWAMAIALLLMLLMLVFNALP